MGKERKFRAKLGRNFICYATTWENMLWLRVPELNSRSSHFAMLKKCLVLLRLYHNKKTLNSRQFVTWNYLKEVYVLLRHQARKYYHCFKVKQLCNYIMPQRWKNVFQAITPTKNLIQCKKSSRFSAWPNIALCSQAGNSSKYRNYGNA